MNLQIISSLISIISLVLIVDKDATICWVRNECNKVAQVNKTAQLGGFFIFGRIVFAEYSLLTANNKEKQTYE